MKKSLSALILISGIVMPLTVLAAQNIWTLKSATIDPTHLPLGNEKYSRVPKAGYVYACNPDAYYSISSTGAWHTGPWVHGSTWDLTEKIWIRGSVRWPNAAFKVTATSSERVITTNDLPIGQPTGIFPVEKNDPAYYYDRNPNPIRPQSFAFSAPLNPVVSKVPSCVQLPVGIGLDGVVFFSALDSHGRDEPAYELQDNCGGMSAPSGIYHRYMPSPCIPHIMERNALVGYALDGFGIFSPFDANGKELTTSDLDECHGTTTPIMWDGKRVTMYHYVLTRDFPYSISCYRGTPMYIPIPPPPGAFVIPIIIFWKHWSHYVLLTSVLVIAVILAVRAGRKRRGSKT